MRYYVLFFALLLVFALGCSSGKGNWDTDPLVPAKDSASSDVTHQVWGLWQFTASPEEGTLDFVPLRQAEMHLNALPFLEPPALLNLTLEGLEFNGNIIDADIGLRHPFLGLNEFSGFDVCGVLISNGTESGYNDPDIVMAGEGDTRLLNPDGWTRWWNPAEFPSDGTMFGYKDGLLGAPDSFADFNCNLNGYKFFCDDIDNPDDPVSTIPVESRCVFSAGQKNVRHYSIEMGADGLVFNYAVDANWQFPQGDPPWEVPADFGAEANRPEAWNIVVTESENSLWNDGMENGGSLSLLIDVWDHFDAGLNTIWLDSPGNFTYTVSSSTAGGGNGYSTYQVDILDATPSPESIEILIGVECEQDGYQGMVPGKAITSYFKYTAEVDDESPVIICGETIHEYEGRHYINGPITWNLTQRGDLTVLESGKYAGDCVIKASVTTSYPYPGNYIRFDPDNPADADGTAYFSLPGYDYIYPSTVGWSQNACLDQNPVNAHIGVVNGCMFDKVQIVDEDGVFVENIVVSDPATPQGYFPNVPGMDFDGDGDLWLVTDIMGEQPGTPDPVWQLRHYELQTSSPYYVENVSDRLDITTDLVNPDAPSNQDMWWIVDIAISYSDDALIVFAATSRSIFVKWDISVSPPVKLDSADLIPNNLSHCQNPGSGITRCDIEIDHMDPVYEKCRWVVMYQIYVNSAVEVHIMRFDSDFNILADEISSIPTAPWSLTINTDPVLRNVIMDNYDIPYNDFWYYTMPGSDW